MNPNFTRLISRGTFIIRLIVFLLVPLFYNGAFRSQALVIGIVALLFTWIIDLLSGATIWFSARKETYFIYIGYLLLLAAVLFQDASKPVTFLWFAPLMLITLCSDAITNSRRWKILVPATALFWLLYTILHPRLTIKHFDFQTISMPWYILIYSFIPVMASLARLFFPRTKNLIHTSLDYPSIRIELLSMGMKKLAAFGLKRL